MPLHHVTGALAVGSVQDAEVAVTYNLIVADFHTYFVGKTNLLTHDNTVLRPTNAVVPGLTRR